VRVVVAMGVVVAAGVAEMGAPSSKPRGESDVMEQNLSF
jgi:hypothetical protein